MFSSMSAAFVKYTKVGQGGSESTIFDYSSAFKYEAMNPREYRSAFDYGTPHHKQQDVDLHKDRGLEHKSFGIKVLYWGTVALYFLLIFITFPLSAWFVIKKIKSDEQVIVSRLGIIKCLRGPAITMVIPCLDKTTTYSTNLRAFNVPPQKVMTSDGLLVEFGGILKYCITNAERTCFAAQDIDHTMRVTAQAVASRYIHSLKEKELVDSAGVRAANAHLKAELQRTFLEWGVAVNSYEIIGLTGVLRIESEDALQTVLEPLKQWFFGAEGAGQSSMAQISSMFTTSSTEANPSPTTACTTMSDAPSQSQITCQSPDLTSLRETLSPHDLLSAVKTVSNRQLVRQIDTIYKFVIPDDDPGVYYMDLKNGDGDCGLGEPPIGKQDTTITVTLADMRLMFTGSLQPFDAYMSGRLQISGDISGAMKLDGLVTSIASVSTPPDVQAQ